MARADCASDGGLWAYTQPCVPAYLPTYLRHHLRPDYMYLTTH